MAENSAIKLNILEPRATEKTYGEQTKRFYVFQVEKSMSKQAIAKMVEKEFNVTVTDVKTLIRKGKKTRYSRGRHAYPGTTYRQDKKYAYVRLKEGDSIRVFEEENEGEASVADKATKKAAEKLAARAEKQEAKEKAREEKAEAKAQKMADKAAKSEADKNSGKEKK